MEVEFVTSAANLAGRPAEILPEFAFIGRSNCGKSTLINHFLRRRGMAKTSGKPGKTRLLNYFLVSGRYYLVDLPGYGYAKVSKQQREVWMDLFRQYIEVGDRPMAVFHLLDVRRDPSPEDRELSEMIQDCEVPFGLAITKIDKIGASRRPARYKSIIEAMELPPDTPFFPTSAVKGIGREAMISWVDAMIAGAESEE